METGQRGGCSVNRSNFPRIPLGQNYILVHIAVPQHGTNGLGSIFSPDEMQSPERTSEEGTYAC